MDIWTNASCMDGDTQLKHAFRVFVTAVLILYTAVADPKCRLAVVSVGTVMNITYRWYPAKSTLSAMRKHGG